MVITKELGTCQPVDVLSMNGRLVQWSFTWFGAFSSTGSNPVATHAAKKSFEENFAADPLVWRNKAISGKRLKTIRRYPVFGNATEHPRVLPGSETAAAVIMPMRGRRTKAYE
jgi:hypothetical protein